MSSLKHLYLKKRLFFMDRVVEHKSKLEAHFQAFYKALDDIRNKLLADENRIQNEIENYEFRLQRLLKRCS